MGNSDLPLQFLIVFLFLTEKIIKREMQVLLLYAIKWYLPLLNSKWPW